MRRQDSDWKALAQRVQMAPSAREPFLLLVLLSVGAHAGPVQLMGSDGATSRVGVLQVKTDGDAFGTVCGMNLAAADVVCRQLGYDFGTVTSSPCSSYGAANLCGESGSPVAMQDLRCTGGELSVLECEWSAPSATCLVHDLDSVVYCGTAGGYTREGSVRLLSADGSPSLSASGIVEIFSAGSWSSVCGLNAGAAAVLCKSLGFAGASADAVTTAQSTKAPMVGGLRCSGSEASPLACSFEAGGDVYCAANEAASIQCRA